MAEWTGKPLAAHRDADVYRFEVARRVAVATLAGKVRGAPRVEQVGKLQIRSASAMRDGVEAMIALAKKRPAA